MKPSSFEYHAPTTLSEVVDLLSELGDEAKILSGGQSLIPMLALRLTAFPHLIDIGRVEDLKGIERRGDALRIGATTTEAVVEHSDEVRATVPLVAKATPLIGHFQIRNRGTLGGSIAHADPAAELPAVALTLGATLELQSKSGSRTVEAEDYFEGLWATCMTPDEILVGVSFPIWGERSTFGISEFARRHGDFAVAGAAVGIELDSDNRVERCAIGLFGLGSTPERGYLAESESIGKTLDELSPEELGRLAIEELQAVPADLHGSEQYRRRVGAAMVARALESARKEAAVNA